MVCIVLEDSWFTSSPDGNGKEGVRMGLSLASLTHISSSASVKSIQCKSVSVCPMILG